MICNYLIAALLLLAAVPAYAEERDPFQPFGTVPAATVAAPTESSEGTETRQSLANYSLDSFKLVGVLIAPDQSLAVLQARDSKDYIVTTGDHVGKEGGTVETIRRDGITVKVGDNAMDMPVSNKVETVHDKKD